VTDSRGAGTPDWARVNEIFHHAIEAPPAERAAIVGRESGGDTALAAEVMSLLAAHERAGEFIERPAMSADAIVALATGSEIPDDWRIGPYRIRRVIGEGGMGVVYFAEDTRLGRTVALKAVAPKFAGDETRRERLRREARAAASLNHPGIATVYALEDIDGQLFIASEYVPGETLRDVLARGPLGASVALAIGAALARALAAAHDRGIVHRDLKPENVMRTPAGDVKILDFGLARGRAVTPGEVQLTADGGALGTPAYMSPEQIRGDAIDARSDLFALGVLLYELASGVHPFAGADPAATVARILEATPAPLATRLQAASDPAVLSLDAIVRTLLKKDPDGRFASAHQLAEAIAGHRTPTGVPGSGALVEPLMATARGTPLWWWKFHQATASLVYAGLLVPVWLAHRWAPGRMGFLVFLIAATGAICAISLRLHLWFTIAAYPHTWWTQAKRARTWLTIADTAFALSLIAAGLGLLYRDVHAETTVILIVAAAAVAISFAIIEPATERAALGDQGVK